MGKFQLKSNNIQKRPISSISDTTNLLRYNPKKLKWKKTKRKHDSNPVQAITVCHKGSEWHFCMTVKQTVTYRMKP